MIAGLDIGTSNCKLSVYDGGRLIAEASASYEAGRENGRHTLDANRVWASVQSLFRQAVAATPRAAWIRALAVSSLGEAAVPVDADGKTLGDALLFWDPSGREEMREMVDKLGTETIQDITGVIPDPMYTLCKMAWQKKHHPAFDRIRHFLLFEDFIIYRLTGERRISYSLAGRTMGFDVKARDWSRTMFEAAGVDPELMSRPVASGTPAGMISPRVRDGLGLRGDTLVTTGGHDQMCVAVGAGAVREGVASNGSGTVEVMAAVLPESVEPRSLYADAYTISIHADPARRFTYSCNATGSLLLSWYTKNFGDPDSKTPFADFEERAPDRPTSLLALPYVAGSGTPFMDLSARGGIVGVGLETSKYDIYRALMEGLAYDLAYNMKKLKQAGVAVSELRCTGGGSLSKMWLQIKADATGVPVRTLRSHQAGALGCMMLAAVAAGEYANLYEAVDHLVEAKEVFEPNRENHEFYEERIGRFMEFFEASRRVAGR